MKKWIIGFLALTGALTLVIASLGLAINSLRVSSDTPERQVIQPPTTKPLKAENIPIDKLHKLVNEHRLLNSLHELTLEPLLNQSAAEKCNNMVTNDYWAHTSDDGTEFWPYIGNYIEYLKAGENLAYGYKNPEDTFVGWRRSKTHNSNLLDPQFSRVGYAVCYSDNYQGYENLVVVQHFVN
jgi:uncharacterized protein YkwD